MFSTEEFEEKYPKEKYKYVKTGRREKGHMGQTEIYSYDIVDIATGETVYKATYTDHMNVNGFAKSQYWE
ncbi:hypothetical protein [Pantoea agglomerans]|uniref:hypothetical protein n=1 Tax=Enterobacter agglomerans TaxID=549 RepID=UPI000E216DB4|nr:hypothetical protein [Pantoea agglomerans]MDQ0629385.1 hypothetical protein [Pantoea agglomerans]WNK29204.1 hypothetical protein RM157_11560 [Pantoea agglomerans]